MDTPYQHVPPNHGEARIAAVGGTGFIGSHVIMELERRWGEAAVLPAFRVTSVDGDDPTAEARRWQASNPDTFEKLVAALAGLDVLIYAAGVAEPASSCDRELFAGNAVHPAVAALAAREAGVRRLVHVSSAVVQGRLDPLDESPRVSPLSPYARSKVAAERVLRGGGNLMPDEVVLYRPTSVLSVMRQTTRQFARFARLPVCPVIGEGDRPAPVCLVENVAAGILFAATMRTPPEIVLQPWEGLTTRALLELFGPRRVISVPPAAARMGMRAVVPVTARSARLTAMARRVEVLMHGQGVEAGNLSAAGFVPPVGSEGWIELAKSVARRPRTAGS